MFVDCFFCFGTSPQFRKLEPISTHSSYAICHSTPMDLFQLVSLAAKGVPEARMLLSMRRAAVQNQNEQDRRWKNMCAASVKLKAEGKAPVTCKEHLELMHKYGFVPCCALSAAQQRQHMIFPQFMQACGGVAMIEDYPAKGEPDSPAKCECCKQPGK